MRRTRNYNSKRHTFLGSGDEDVDASVIHINPHAAACYAVKYEERTCIFDNNEQDASNM